MTMIAEDTIRAEWLAWARGSLIPQITDAGNFSSHRFLTVLDSPNEGATYCIQFFAERRDDISNYLQGAHPAIQAGMTQRFGQSVLLFMTVLEYLD